MHILITGGSGFLGRALTQQLQQSGIDGDAVQVTWVSRSRGMARPNGVNLLTYTDLQITEQSFDIIVNLAGAGIADRRWSDKRKQQLYDSRLQPTQTILDYLKRTQAQQNVKLLVSGSAIGWYGVQGDKPLTENSDFHDEFTHQLCEQWEALALQARQLDVPTAIVRTGVVISPNGGMVGRLKLPFQLGLGGKLGNGEQNVSWIGLYDWVRAVQFIIASHLTTKPEASEGKSRVGQGKIYNLTAPQAISNTELTQALGQWLNRPTLMTLPRPVISAIFGEMSVLLVEGQSVVPQALLDAGFEFEHATVGLALQQFQI